MSSNQFSVGQELYYVSRGNRRDKSTVTIEKLGNKWMYLSNRARADIHTLEVDGGRGYLYASKSEYDDLTELNSLWTDFRRKVSDKNVIPKHLTVEKIQKVVELLGL